MKAKIRKGIFETVALAVVTLMIVGVLSVLGTQFAVDMNQIIRRETVSLAAQRVSTTMLMMNGVREGNYQLEFPYGYRIYEGQEDNVRIGFSYNDEANNAVIPSMNNIENSQAGNYVRTDNLIEDPEKYKRFYCITKDPGGIELEVGECG
jgi:hypothetical protein